MRAVDLIRKKRDGGILSDVEIRWLVHGLLSGEIAEYQWSALLMAIVWRGMTSEETAALTDAMMHSGEIVDLSAIPGRKVDKHSTGGVGDKTSLVLAPIAAACGVPVPMVSGRGLGHTGGTLDKLESIPGFRVDLNLDQYRQVLKKCGLVLIGQTRELAPADKLLYALRDATATVESIPLIASSIMSKKLAEGIDALVLDVKTGHGAFLQRLEESRALARAMCAIGRGLGKSVVALITRMDQPLGRAVGNAVEVEESIACLKGEGPADLVDLSVELAAEMLVLGGIAPGLAEARARCHQSIADGTALERFAAVIAALGGDPSVIERPQRLPQPRHRLDLGAPRAGMVQAIAARDIGLAVMHLGAGRARTDSAIDHAVGLWIHKKIGDPVAEHEPLATVLSNKDDAASQHALATIRNAFTIAPEPVTPAPVIVERLAMGDAVA